MHVVPYEGAASGQAVGEQRGGGTEPRVYEPGERGGVREVPCEWEQLGHEAVDAGTGGDRAGMFQRDAVPHDEHHGSGVGSEGELGEELKKEVEGKADPFPGLKEV